MTFTADQIPGRFVPGTSWLHRADPRLKLLAVPALVTATFAASGTGQLLLLSALTLVAWGTARLPAAGAWKTLRLLRWLLLFTLLLHTLFSPGHTLFGTTWLSADGLFTGLRACWRIVLALLLALLLASTTSPAALAGALARLLEPLERWRVPVGEGAELVVLVFHFIPVFRHEALDLYREQERGRVQAARGLLERARVAGRMLRPLLLRLVDRADDLARQLAAGLRPAELAAPVLPGPLARGQLGLFCCGVLVTLLAYRGLA